MSLFAKRLTLRQLGAKCGRTAGYLSQVENGAVAPSIDSISRIAEALHGRVISPEPTQLLATFSRCAAAVQAAQAVQQSAGQIAGEGAMTPDLKVESLGET